MIKQKDKKINIMGKTKKIYESSYFPFITMFILFLFIHLLYTRHTDDLTEMIRHKSFTFLDEIKYIKTYYMEWSSRSIINFLISIMLHFRARVWMLLDLSILVLFVKELSDIFRCSQNKKNSWISVCLLLLYPFDYQTSAGWICTTMTYLWPSVISIVFLNRVKRIIEGEKMSTWSNIFCGICLIYATNHEQIAVAFTLIITVINISLLFMRKVSLSLIIYNFISFVALIFHVTAPGNNIRTNHQISLHFVDFMQLSTISKLELGISSTMYEFLFKFNPIFFFLALEISIIIWTKYKNSIYRFCGSIPLVISIVFGILKTNLKDTFKGIDVILNSLNSEGIISVKNYSSYRAYIPLVLILITIIALVLALYLIFENTFETVFVLSIMGAGLASRIILAFSPTIWFSGMRTYTFLYIIIIYVCVLLAKKYGEILSERHVLICNYILYILAAVNYINLLCTIRQVF